MASPSPRPARPHAEGPRRSPRPARDTTPGAAAATERDADGDPDADGARDADGGSGALLLALLGRFAAIVGDKAAVATFHYAAVQEGVGLGRAHQAQGLEAGLQAAAHALGQTIDAEVRDDRVAVSFTGGIPVLPPVLRAIVCGLYAGVLRGHRGATYTCTLDAEGHKVSCTLGAPP